jgi:hypothetical protein
MKLLIDMNLAPRWVEFLTRMSFQAAHWSAVGDAKALDADIMAYGRGARLRRADQPPFHYPVQRRQRLGGMLSFYHCAAT